LQSLIRQGYLTKEGKKVLANLLPIELPVKYDVHEYISLKRPAKSKGYDDVLRAIPDNLTKLTNLGIKLTISSLD